MSKDEVDWLDLYFAAIRKFPLLSREEEVELAKKMEEGGEKGKIAERRLVECNQRLVVSIAKKFQNLGMSLEDLIQSGNVGLLKAAQKWDWRRGYKFSTLAHWWVSQAVRRVVSNQGRTIRLPVHMSEWLSDVKRASHSLAQELGREPSPEEISSQLGISVRKVKMIVSASREALSLDEPVGDEGSACLADFVEDESESTPLDTAFQGLLKEELDDLLKGLRPREEKIMRMRYGLDGSGESKSLKQVGEEFGVTRERVRQIQIKCLRQFAHPIGGRKLSAYLD